MDRSGHWVAFSPCCHVALPTLVVASVMGGKVLEPLAKHPLIYAVGGIGWSPDGRRIAFEGWTGSYPDNYKSLWTVRPDGTGLRRVLKRPKGRYNSSNALAWTHDGILIVSGRNLVAVKAGETRTILRRVSQVRISGDGKRIVTKRFNRRGQSLWIGNPDGSDHSRIVGPFNAGETIWYDDVIPNYDATAMLSYRDVPATDTASSSNDFVTWDSSDGPSGASVFELINKGGYPATWN